MCNVGSVNAVAARRSRPPKGRTPSKRGPQQSVNLRARFSARQAIVKLQLHESNEERIERASGRQQLLGDLRERPARLDHGGEGGDLAAGAVDMSNGGAAIAGRGVRHGVT